MSDDPTNKLSGDESRYDTQPSITTVLERLNEIGDGLRAEMETLRVGQEQLRLGQEQLRAEFGAEIQSLRTEMNGQFANVGEQLKVLDKKLGILTREVLDVRAQQEIYDDRLDKLGQKTS